MKHRIIVKFVFLIPFALKHRVKSNMRCLIKKTRQTTVAMVSVTIALMLFSSITSSNALIQEFPSTSAHVETIQLDHGGDSERFLKVTEGNADSIDSGARIWDSGRALSSWIAKELEPGKCVLELGAGTGIVGLTAAAKGAKSVILTDQPEMVPLLEQNIASNDLSVNTKAVPLLWGCDQEETISSLAEASSTMDGASTETPFFDVICGSDILYSPENLPLLLDTIIQVCTPSKTEVVLAYPRRFTEDMFLELAEEYFDIFPEEEIEPNIFLLRMHRRNI